jgi:hypothetical protein
VDSLAWAAVDAPTAAFLAWLSSDATDADGRAKLCASYRASAPGEITVPYVSRRLACPGDDHDDSFGCRAYRLLSMSRPAAGGGALEESFCGGNGMDRALKLDERRNSR